MNILQKIQNLPEGKKKIILWLVVIIIGLTLFSFWINNFKERIKNFEIGKFKKEINLPEFDFELPKTDEKEQ